MRLADHDRRDRPSLDSRPSPEPLIVEPCLTLGTAPDRDDHQPRSGDPRPLGPRAGRRREPRREARGLRRARAVPPDRAEPLRAGPGLAVPPCALPLRHPGRPGDPRHGPDPVRRLHGPDGAAVRAGDRGLPRGDASATGPTARSAAPWPRPTSRSPFRPWPTRCGGRSGAARATAGCSGSAASTSTRSASIPRLLERESDDGALPDPGRADARCGWTSRTAAGPTSSSSAWIFPKARGC